MIKKSLRQWRREKDLTQEELAKLAGVTARTISYWEEDSENLRSASFKNVASVAQALGIKPDNFNLPTTSKILKLTK